MEFSGSTLVSAAQGLAIETNPDQIAAKKTSDKRLCHDREQS
jgi:hypothetical protein